MADIKKVITLDDGTLTNLVEPTTKLSVNYKPVTTWYDGTAMTNAKVDGDLYTRKGTKYYRKVIDKDGELFLEKDTMAQMRALTTREILYLKAGVYKGIKLNGYYAEGDTPAPIDYYISSTSATDDGGSVVAAGGLKLEHVFVGEVNLAYYGIRVGLDVLDNHSRVNLAIAYSSRNGNITVVSPAGHYDFFDKVTIPVSNTSIFGEDVSTTWWYNGNGTFIECRSPLNAGLQSIRIRRIRFRDRLGNGDIALLLYKVRQSTFDDVEIWGTQSTLKGWLTAGLYIDGEALEGSWNNRFRNFKCANMDGVGHLLRTTQSNAVFFDKASLENCGRSVGNTLVWICGGNGVTYRDTHFEVFNKAIRISPYDASFNLRSVNILNCYFEPLPDASSRCVYISNKDKDGGTARVINLTGLNITGGYWAGHGSDYIVEIDVISGNTVSGVINYPFYRLVNNAFLKSSTGGERVKIQGRMYGNIPLLEKTLSSNCYSREYGNGSDIVNSFNKYINPSNPDGYYNIEKPYQFLRLNSSQTINSNSVLTVVSGQPTSAGNITLTLPLLSELGLENEILIFKGNDDANTITVNASSGNQFNTPTPQSRNWNVLTKVNQYIKVVKDTTSGWRVVDYGVLNRNKFLYNRNNPNGSVVSKSGTMYFQLDNSDNVIDVFIKTVTDNDSLNWISIIPKNATTTVKGLVNQSAKVDDVSTTPPSPLSAQTVTTIEEAQTAISNLVTMVNAMQANEVELKSKLNAKLTADRASNQQATT